MTHIIQGAGLSLRSQYFSHFLHQPQPVQWLEILADQLIGTSDIVMDKIIAITKQYPTTLHCVSMNIAGVTPLNYQYLDQLKYLIQIINPVYVSDHLCWCAYESQYSHDLLPFPYLLEDIDSITKRIDIIQNYLQKPLLLENLSHYMSLNHQISEAEMLNQLCDKTGCGVLLDVNNVYVSSQNLNYDAKHWIQSLTAKHIKQMHLAGHIQADTLLIDTHSRAVPAAVWDLYQWTIQHIGPIATCLEWDNDLPSWDVCVAEIGKIESYLNNTYLPPSVSLHKIESPACHRGLDPGSSKQRLQSEGHNNTLSLQRFQQQHWQRLISPTAIAPSNRWSIHQNSMRMQRQKSLQQIYGVMEQLLGPDYWQHITQRFVLEYPSNSYDIINQLDLFANFLDQHIPESNHPLVDLATYLWQWHLTFHNKPISCSDLLTLQNALTQEQLFKLTLSDSIHLLTAHYPIHVLWEACQPEHEHNHPLHVLQDLAPQTTYYLFYQQQQLVHAVIIDKNIWQGLQLLQKPITLDAWITEAEQIPNLPAETLSQWYANGLVKID